MTEILSLPLLRRVLATGTNEDWLSEISFTKPAGRPFDLTGIGFECALRAPGTIDPIIYASTANGGLAVSDGRVHFAVAAPAMASVPPGDYPYDLLATADGHVRRVVTGIVSVIAGVTHGVYSGAPASNQTAFALLGPLLGHGAPAATLGITGQIYIDLDAPALHVKAAGNWTAGFGFVGASPPLPPPSPARSLDLGRPGNPFLAIL